MKPDLKIVAIVVIFALAVGLVLGSVAAGIVAAVVGGGLAWLADSGVADVYRAERERAAREMSEAMQSASQEAGK